MVKLSNLSLFLLLPTSSVFDPEFPSSQSAVLLLILKRDWEPHAHNSMHSLIQRKAPAAKTFLEAAVTVTSVSLQTAQQRTVTAPTKLPATVAQAGLGQTLATLGSPGHSLSSRLPLHHHHLGACLRLGHHPSRLSSWPSTDQA